MKSGELRKVPKRDDKTLAKDLLRPPEGSFEAMVDDGKDDPLMTESVKGAKMEDENMFNDAASKGSDEAKKPNLQCEHLSAPALQADHIALLDRLREAELELGRMKKENSLLREENTRLKEENLPPRKLENTILENFKKKLE